eukprot:gene2345-2813_t
MIEKLPTPYGLVRYGVAPDHPEVKNVTNEFDQIAQHENFTFLGNVKIGDDIKMNLLKNYFDMVCLCYGSGSERTLNIPGEDQIISAREFVNWYNGLPDRKNLENSWFKKKTEQFTELLQKTKEVVIIGQGNVALDVGRILCKQQSDLKQYDVINEALDLLTTSPIEKVSIVGRRGPIQAACTTKELRELTKMNNLNVHADHLELDEISKKDLVTQGRTRKRFFDLLTSLEEKPDSPKSLDFRFFLNPVEVIGSPLEGIKFEKTKLTEDLKTVGTGEYVTIPCQMAFRSVGYKNQPMDEVPFDNEKGIIPNEQGRVGSNIYVSGWLKRGPVGVIATNVTDAKETSECMIQDSIKLSESEETLGGRAFETYLTTKNVEYVTFDQFKKIDDFEVGEGKKCGKSRNKITDIDEMLSIARK